jgi:hypothetical protein
MPDHLLLDDQLPDDPQSEPLQITELLQPKSPQDPLLQTLPALTALKFIRNRPKLPKIYVFCAAFI